MEPLISDCSIHDCPTACDALVEIFSGSATTAARKIVKLLSNGIEQVLKL